MPTHNTAGRAARRNNQGGSGFKKQKKEEHYRTKAAREAAEDMIDLLHMFYNTPAKLDEPKHAEDKEALKWMRIGRVVKCYGNGRMDVLCHDYTTRQCVVRGLLRDKKKCHIELDSTVIVSLRSCDEDRARLMDTTSDIVGICNVLHLSHLSKLPLPKRCLSGYDPADDADDGLFDRTIEGDGALGDEDTEPEVNMADL